MAIKPYTIPVNWFIKTLKVVVYSKKSTAPRTVSPTDRITRPAAHSARHFIFSSMQSTNIPNASVSALLLQGYNIII